ncbi:MAG: UDP-N-acetylmuramoyl-L-alanine--D-glutamate ligase [Clostridia bacterium]|nr:UDP-N-acetylmuramoyl-L-alanine--D-glutamate ligase [Clostridia bacterium]
MREGYGGFRKEIENKKIAVAGMGISNKPLPRIFEKAGASSVRCFDKNFDQDTADTVKDLQKGGFDIEYYAGEDYLSRIGEGYDLLFRTPGLRPDIPELANAACEMTSEMEMFLRFCPAKIYGVTGSDGKTTTTTLISLFLEKNTSKRGGLVYLGGNIGTPLLEKLGMITEKDRVCVELSSFQLMNMSVGTDVAVITNVSPNHLNYHKTYDEYLDAKGNILKFRDSRGIYVLNRGNKDSERYFGKEGDLRTFSSYAGLKKGENGAFLRGNEVIYRDGEGERKIYDTDKIRIKGLFNVENYMAAYCATKDEEDIEDARTIAAEFGGVSHRMEFVRELDGVKYFNSSIDSSPNRTINALSVFDKKIVLIAGGKDKGISYDAIGKTICEKVRSMILTGPTAKLIEDAARKYAAQSGTGFDIDVYHCDNYPDAVKTARKVAKQGDDVVLSPASTSFDMFKNFEERGETFKKLVMELK